MAEKLSFALFQSPLHWEDRKGNLEMFSDKISNLRSDCDIIVLPEMFSTGFTMNAGHLAEDMKGSTVSWMREEAAKSGKIITGSFIAAEDGKFYNRLVWMDPSGSYQHYDKKHLFRMADEDAHYSSGNQNITVKCKGWKIRPLICYDLRFPVWSRNRFMKLDNNLEAEYDVLLYVANWPAARSLAWDILLRARAVENQVYCVGLNRVGRDGLGKDYNGHSAVVSPKGDYLLAPVDGEEGLLEVTLDPYELSSFREKFPQGLDADDFRLI